AVLRGQPNRLGRRVPLGLLRPRRAAAGTGTGQAATRGQAAAPAGRAMAAAVGGGEGQADAALVTGADRPVAAPELPRPAGAVGVTRNDLPGDLLPGPRRHASGSGPPGRVAQWADRPQTPVPAGPGRAQPQTVGAGVSHL